MPSRQPVGCLNNITDTVRLTASFFSHRSTHRSTRSQVMQIDPRSFTALFRQCDVKRFDVMFRQCGNDARIMFPSDLGVRCFRLKFFQHPHVLAPAPGDMNNKLYISQTNPTMLLYKALQIICLEPTAGRKPWLQSGVVSSISSQVILTPFSVRCRDGEAGRLFSILAGVWGGHHRYMPLGSSWPAFEARSGRSLQPRVLGNLWISVMELETNSIRFVFPSTNLASKTKNIET